MPGYKIKKPMTKKKVKKAKKAKKSKEKEMTTKSVKAPKGFHWMKKNSSFKLMKGTYKPHKGAVKMAKFTVQKKHD